MGHLSPDAPSKTMSQKLANFLTVSAISHSHRKLTDTEPDTRQGRSEGALCSQCWPIKSSKLVSVQGTRPSNENAQAWSWSPLPSLLDHQRTVWPHLTVVVSLRASSDKAGRVGEVVARETGQQLRTHYSHRRRTRG